MKEVTFNAPQPAKLRVIADPATAINDGRNVVHVSAMFLDAYDHPALPPANSTTIQFTASLGDLKDHHLPIPKDQPFVETTLTSNQQGEARITASAVGLDTADTVTVQFLFPWLMLAAAVIGGLLGSVLRSEQGRAKRRWGVRLAQNLAVGCVLGLIFYIAALFGAVGALSMIVFDVTKLPAVNELGALALGFVGGYYGSLVLQPARK
jgi:hypothetical protein